MNTESDVRLLIERYLHDVLSGSGPTTLGEVVADADLGHSVRLLRRSFGDLDITPHVIVATGDHAAVHVSVRGVHRGMFQGIPATGRTWTAGCSGVFRIENGRIVDAWVTWDSLAILEQIGAVARPRGSSA